MILQNEAKQGQWTMMVLAFVGVVYLPATFTATLMGMGYIKGDPEDVLVKVGPAQIAAGEMKIYVVLTSLLIILTAGLLGFARFRRALERGWMRRKA